MKTGSLFMRIPARFLGLKYESHTYISKLYV